MPLPVRYCRTIPAQAPTASVHPAPSRAQHHSQEYVLASTCSYAVFLDLYLDDPTLVQEQLTDVRALTGSDFTQDALHDIDDPARQPVPPEQADLSPATERWAIWFDQTEHTVKLPANEKYDEEVVRCPEALEIRSTAPLVCVPDHSRQARRHNPSCNPGTGRQVDLEERDHARSRMRRPVHC